MRNKFEQTVPENQPFLHRPSHLLHSLEPHSKAAGALCTYTSVPASCSNRFSVKLTFLVLFILFIFCLLMCYCIISWLEFYELIK